MADNLNKIVNVASLKELHEHNKLAYMSTTDPTGSGTLTIDSIDVKDVSAEAVQIDEINTGSISADVAQIGGLLGDLEIDGDIILNTSKAIQGVHPTSGETQNLIRIENDGTHIYGDNVHIHGADIIHHVANANGYIPYYKAGDVFNIHIRTAGHCSGDKTKINFSIPLAKPVIGASVVTPTSRDGFVLIQDGFTHGSSDGKYVKPSSYSATLQDNNINITATMSTTTDAKGLNPIAIIWNGTITFS